MVGIDSAMVALLIRVAVVRLRAVLPTPCAAAYAGCDFQTARWELATASARFRWRYHRPCWTNLHMIARTACVNQSVRDSSNGKANSRLHEKFKAHRQRQTAQAQSSTGRAHRGAASAS